MIICDFKIVFIWSFLACIATITVWFKFIRNVAHVYDGVFKVNSSVHILVLVSEVRIFG